eukprot:TRINITY_DN113605_c0_g1_i1.p1 TRINITY_DN113605_c0_g1~~TRINITY_DN113605_c0_g1_i1.p1  ORF type:complete len:475 (+),score=63.00 TRINITY_DN113605_c0_g1_i1:100-1524(+)
MDASPSSAISSASPSPSSERALVCHYELCNENEVEAKADEKKPHDFGEKTIGTLGGIMLLINNVAGPTISLMPGLAQEGGWFSMIFVMSALAAVSVGCGFLLLSAMRAMPGNRNFEKRVEFTDIVRYYLPKPWSTLFMVTYHAYLVMTLMSYIISSAQVMDFASLDAAGGAYGLSLWPQVGWVVGTQEDSSTPFGSGLTVVPLSFIIVGVVCAPCAVKNLDDNVVLQIVAIFGLTVLSGIWLWFFGRQMVAEGSNSLPAVTKSPWGLLGTMLFNFAFMSTLPSWVNEKQADVSVGQCFFWSMAYVVVVYAAIGIVGGTANDPYFQTDQTMFSLLNQSGSRLAQATVIVYPILQNFTSIPVFSILIRYNLLQDGLSHGLATFIAVGLPWALSVPFYTGKGFAYISEVGGMVTSSLVNFVLPVVVYFMAQRLLPDGDGGLADQSKPFKESVVGDKQLEILHSIDARAQTEVECGAK